MRSIEAGNGVGSLPGGRGAWVIQRVIQPPPPDRSRQFDVDGARGWNEPRSKTTVGNVGPDPIRGHRPTKDKNLQNPCKNPSPPSEGLGRGPSVPEHPENPPQNQLTKTPKHPLTGFRCLNIRPKDPPDRSASPAPKARKEPSPCLPSPSTATRSPPPPRRRKRAIPTSASPCGRAGVGGGGRGWECCHPQVHHGTRWSMSTTRGHPENRWKPNLPIKSKRQPAL